MKFGKILYLNEVYTHLILENIEDVDQYYEIFHKDMAEIVANDFMEGYETGTTFKEHVDSGKAHKISELISHRVETSEKPMNIIEICNISDSFLIKKYEGMSRMIDSGLYVRLNSSGGYCSERNLNNYFNIVEVDKKSLASYIHYGHIEDKIIINTEYVFIENDKEVKKDFIDLFNISNKTILYDFKKRTTQLSKVEIYKIFDDGIKNGMKHVCFETTGQDISQISDMIYILEMLLNKNPDIVLTVHMRCYNDNIVDMFKKINFPNYKLEVL